MATDCSLLNFYDKGIPCTWEGTDTRTQYASAVFLVL